MPITLNRAARGGGGGRTVNVSGGRERNALIAKLAKQYEESVMTGKDTSYQNPGECATILSLIRKHYREVLNAEMAGDYVAYVHRDRMDQPAEFGESGFTVKVRLKDDIPLRAVEVYRMEDDNEVRLMHALWPEAKKPTHIDNTHLSSTWGYLYAPVYRGEMNYAPPPMQYRMPPPPSYSFSVQWMPDDNGVGVVGRIAEDDQWELLEQDAVERLREINREIGEQIAPMGDPDEVDG